MMGRLRALGWVFLGVLYFLFAERLAVTAASGFSTGDWFPVLNRVFLLFLLLIGFAAMGFVGQRQLHPLREMGLAFRPGWFHEVLLGGAIGWSGMVACVLPMAVFGALYIQWNLSWHSVGILFLDVLTLAAASLAEEVAFRGYPFQRLIEATGPVTATVLASLAFGVMHLQNPDATAASTLVTMLAGWLLAVAYLRTRGLWVGWGFHFAWNAVMAIVFGLPLSGLTRFSPLMETSTYGPYWLTGGGYGPEGSAVAIVVLLILVVVVVTATRSLKFQYAIPPIVPGGIPVDIDEVARKQHEAAQAHAPAQPAAPTLIQIGGLPGAISRPIAPLAESPDDAGEKPEAERQGGIAD
ncbi:MULTISPECIES: type II CAAX endopeptidase family protein [Acidobacterium]|uniref:Protease, CAAX amino terminal family n=1 Tax=Acidobacterium capsulatum (strain ATCC 51196 / DSM 11244 / BCRC 80197 / JCM 7670 / NBRC 15755 / NCIMB 13165 / 161) TaxID=240015 RepID=C1F1F6_ACIC5|nr:MULTISPECIES: type II CAAX endopeptidase family protein [Acidobacterium]ACO34541.1 protease, CAAX amino terminal family [Acidobacterium capsulatum ATCC 51196]